jgi:hypothetical protein
MQAPDPCVEAASVGEQVEGLLGQPLASVAGIDFEVSIEPSAGREWRLRLDTLDAAQGTRRSRELTAKTCAELADAAAVAITMSIKSLAERKETPAKPPAPVAAAAPPAAALAAAPPPPPSTPPLRSTAALDALLATGAMPSAALGVGLEVALQRGRARVLGLAALFPAQQSPMTNGVAASFQLATGGVLACFAPAWGRVTLLACAGGEAGRLTGEGVNVSAPRARGTLWLAGRGEVGATFALTPNVSAAARAGLAVPMLRPTFLLNDDTVHRADRWTTRTTLGVELAF